MELKETITFLEFEKRISKIFDEVIISDKKCYKLGTSHLNDLARINSDYEDIYHFIQFDKTTRKITVFSLLDFEEKYREIDFFIDKSDNENNIIRRIQSIINEHVTKINKRIAHGTI